MTWTHRARGPTLLAMRSSALLFVLLGLGSCGSEPPEQRPASMAAAIAVEEPASAPPTWTCGGREAHLARDVEPLLMSRCSGEFCHGMSMTSPRRSYGFLVGQASNECDEPRSLVSPGHPEASYLVDNLTGKNLCGGHPMPRGLSNRLSPEQVQVVVDWICAGARND